MSDGALDTLGNPKKDLSYLDGTAAVGRDNDLLLAQQCGSTLVGHTYSFQYQSTSYSLASQTLFGIAVYVPTAATLLGVQWFQVTQGSYTANNNSKIGLYTSDGTNLTQVASCANDSDLWKVASNTYASKAFTTPYAAAAGVYWVLGLNSRSATVTAPTIGARANVLNVGVLKPNNSDVALSFLLSAQTDIPSTTLAWASVSANVSCPWFGVYT